MKGRGNMPTSDVVMSMDQKVVGNNREMRIAARRARIANRLLLASQSAQNAARTKTHSGEEDDAEGPANAQLASSLQNLSSIKGTLSNEVHLLRASIDDCEGQHRYAESQRLQELLRGVEEVKITCKEENVNLAEKWDQICSIAVPQQLAEQILEQRKADKIIHEQQLGWRWRPPSNKFFIDLASAKPDESMDSLDSHMETEQLSSSSGEKVSEMNEHCKGAGFFTIPKQ